MPKVECENCKKDVLGKIGFCIDLGVVGLGDGYAGHVSGVYFPKEIKKDGMFCSFKCLKEWINRQKKLTPTREAIVDAKKNG